MKTKRKPYTRSARWNEAVKNKTNFKLREEVLRLEKELGDVKLVAKKLKISPQRVYILLKEIRENIDIN